MAQPGRKERRVLGENDWPSLGEHDRPMITRKMNYVVRPYWPSTIGRRVLTPVNPYNTTYGVLPT